LTTFKRESRKCITCGADFVVRIPIRDGKELSHLQECPSCLKSQQDTEREKELKVKLASEIEYQRDVWRTQSNISGHFDSKTFSNFDQSLQPEAYLAVKGYADERAYNWKFNDEDGEPPRSLVLSSSNSYGVGKTHLISALLNQIIEQEECAVERNGYIARLPCPIYFVTEPVLLSRIRDSYNRNQNEDSETEEDVYKHLSKFALIVIDDVGKVRPRDYSFLQGVFFRIIDDRYVNDQAVILTTNLSLAELEKHIGGASADRLREMCGTKGFIKMVGDSYRKKRGQIGNGTSKD
jgi:DNA replication protein DnaC